MSTTLLRHGQRQGGGARRQEAAVLEVIQGGQKAMSMEQETTVPQTDTRRTQANRDRRQARKRKLTAEQEERARHRSTATSSGGKSPGSPKGKGKGKSKDQSGLELCFSWASGKGHCAEVPPGGDCKGPVKRIHKCRICLSPSHRDADCRA